LFEYLILRTESNFVKKVTKTTKEFMKTPEMVTKLSNAAGTIKAAEGPAKR
jgi:hypothetical protein